MVQLQSNERGLTRSSVEEDKFQISNQFGGISKDTWISDSFKNYKATRTAAT
jgi:uncharacterized circularly permuted ATP-grasp superfamily protein